MSLAGLWYSYIVVLIQVEMAMLYILGENPDFNLVH